MTYPSFDWSVVDDVAAVASAVVVVATVAIALLAFVAIAFRVLQRSLVRL